MFTILTAGWVQAEYRATQLMPWVLMLRGQTPASQSIFLDYMSKWNVASLFHSLRQKHFLVSLCVAGSLILNGITVFSTGLFELEPVSVNQPIDLTVLKKFGGAEYNTSTSDASPLAACLAYLSRNMSRPAGILEPYVYTPLIPASIHLMGNDTLPTGRVYETDLDVIKPSFDCQDATVSWEPATASWAHYDTPVYKTTDGCRYHLTYPPFDVGSNRTNADGSVVSIDFSTEFRGCQGEYASIDTNMGGWTPPSWDTDWRVWAAVARTNDSSAVKQPHVSVCKPHYTMYRGPVKIWREAGESAVSADINPDTLSIKEGIKDVQATKLLYSAFGAVAKGSFLLTDLVESNGYIFAANGVSLDKFWTNNTVFTDAVTNSLLCMMREVVKNDLSEDKPYDTKGDVEFTEDRLFVRQMSFWLMSVLLAMLIGLVVMLLCFFVPVAVCPNDTGSIGGMAAVFSRSPELMTAFKNSQFESEKQMEESRPGQTHYSTFVDTKGTFTILPQGQINSQATKSCKSEDSSLTWWYPFSSTWFTRITVVALPLAVIIGLEVVYHISASRHGITLTDGKSPYIHYVWVYIPALVMFTIRCLFTSVEFGARIIQPYSTLRKGHAPAETSILENQLRKVAVYGVFDTLRKRQWALTAATMSLLLATLNPIIVSGLFTTKASGRTSPIDLVQTTRWNLGDPADPQLTMEWYRSKNFTTDFTSGLILNLNLSEPQWTYNNLVFPHFALDTASPPKDGFVNARIPALRTRLTCSQDSNNGNCSQRSIGMVCNMHSSCFSEVSTTRVSNIEYFLESALDSSLGDKRPSYCPTDNMLYGKYAPDRNNTLEHHYIVCNATMEEVDVETKLQLPSLSIDTDTPPKIVESSARKPFNTNAYSFPPFYSLGTDYLFSGDPKFNNAFLETLVQGVDGVPMDELLNPDKLIERANVVYGIIVAQVLNTGARESFSDPYNKTYLVEPATMVAPKYAGTFHDGRKYLVQNKISTRLLEAVLASMVVCALIALFAMQTKRVLPKSPTSIASVASFLYGSNLLNSVFLPGAEWYSADELKRRGTFEGRTFSMGWWQTDKKGRTNLNESEDPHSLCDTDTASLSSDPELRGSQVDGGRLPNEGRRFGIDVDLGGTPFF